MSGKQVDRDFITGISSMRVKDGYNGGLTPQYLPFKVVYLHRGEELSHMSSRGSDLQAQQELPKVKNRVEVQVGLVGDAQVGKTSLMVKYVQNVFDEEYTQTLGVNFLKRKVSIRSTDIVFSIMDLGGQREFINMLPIASLGSSAIVFLFDLTRPETLSSIKEWYRQAHGLNETAVPLLVGTKYDLFVDLDPEYQEQLSRTSMEYAQVMDAPLVFCSTARSVNVQKIFKIALAKIFKLTLTIPEINEMGDPLLIYKSLGNNRADGEGVSRRPSPPTRSSLS